MGFKTQIAYGSSGADVKELQKILNRDGYNLTVDGIFGAKTKSAVQNYQNKHGLAVDGIVGNNTWDSLTSAKGGATASPTSDKSESGFTYNPFKYDDYTESDAVIRARNSKNNAQYKVDNYGDFSFSKQNAWDNLYNEYMNRKDFSYDLNADAIYQQYKDKYIQQGKMAMADTIGQASAMTGGYGNSYAATVGNQAYQASLENLNDIIPELYQMAYDRYNQKGQDMLNALGVLGNERDYEYGVWGDKYNQLVSERDYYNSLYDNERTWDYGQYSDDRNFAYGQYADDKSYAYQNHRDGITDSQWQAEFDEAQRQFNEDLAFKKQQYEDSKITLGGYPADDSPNDTKPKDNEVKAEEPKGWKDHDTDALAKNQTEKGGSYYSTARKAVDSMIAQGKDYNTLMAYAQEMVGNSYLSKSEYMTLVQYIRNKRGR